MVMSAADLDALMLPAIKAISKELLNKVVMGHMRIIQKKA
jgi:hypothetical protein